MKYRMPALMLAFGLLLCGCAGQGASGDEGFKVVTSFYPMYIFTLNITDGAEGVTVQNMASSAAGCLHEYNLLPADMKAVEGADAYIYNGGVENFMDRLTASYPDMEMIEAGAGCSAGDNCHYWMDPSLAVKEIYNIANGLGAADPSNAGLYRKNAEAYAERIEALGSSINDALAPYAGRGIVVFHEAFEPFAKSAGIEILAFIEDEDGSEPSARRIAELAEGMKQAGNVPIFTDENSSPASADVLAGETGSRIYKLDTFVSGPYEKDAYEKALQKDTDILLEAFR